MCPLFASQSNEIHIKDILPLIFIIFVIFAIIISITFFSTSIKDYIMVKENIELLKKFDRKHKNKDINNHKVKFSLNSKVIILNVGLTIVLIALIANPVSYLMMENQEEILTTGLQKRITVLMESISNGAKAYLPTENILELNLIANQSDTLAEAEYVTILSYHTDTHGINSDIDYVWASNDKNILK